MHISIGFSGDGFTMAENSLRDTLFVGKPNLYYTIGNASTMISAMALPMSGILKGETGAAEWFKSRDNSKYEMDVEDTAIANVKYEDGVTLFVKLSWLAPIEADCTYFRVTGAKGQMHLKTLFGFSTDRLWKEDTLQFNIDGKEEVIQFDMSENKSREAFGEMLSYYCDSLRCRRTEYTNCYDALRTVALIENLYRIEEQDESWVVQALAGD